MKKTVVFSFTVLMIAQVCLCQDAKRSFLLKGKVKGTSSGLIYMSYLDEERGIVSDSAVVKDGSFSFKGDIDVPIQVYLRLKESIISTSNTAALFIEPGVITI